MAEKKTADKPLDMAKPLWGQLRDVSVDAFKLMKAPGDKRKVARKYEAIFDNAEEKILDLEQEKLELMKNMANDVTPFDDNQLDAIDFEIEKQQKLIVRVKARKAQFFGAK